MALSRLSSVASAAALTAPSHLTAATTCHAFSTSTSTSTSSSSSSSSYLSRHPPFVYHPAYTAPDWPESHTFAMWKFADAADQLVADGVVRCAEDFVAPAEPIPDELFLLAHDRAYYDAFVHDTLEPALSRRIGFVRIIPVPIYLCTPAHS